MAKTTQYVNKWDTTVTVEYLRRSIKKNQHFLVYFYYFLWIEEILPKRKSTSSKEAMNKLIGEVRFWLKESIEKELLKQILYKDEIGHMRLVGTRSGVWDKSLNLLVQGKYGGALGSAFQSSIYTIEESKGQKPYVVTIYGKTEDENTIFFFKKF